MNWIYLAGWFDADGSLTIQDREVSSYGGTLSGKTKKRYVQITFGNTDGALIRTIQQFLGLERLKVHVLPANTYPAQKHTFYKLTVAKKSDAERILRGLEPHCLTKRRKIRQALLFLVRLRKEKEEQRAKKKVKRKKPNVLYC